MTIIIRQIEHLESAVMAYGESNRHMTDDVSKVLIVTSVGYVWFPFVFLRLLQYCDWAAIRV